MWNRRLRKRIVELESRLRELEEQVKKNIHLTKEQMTENVDQALRDLARTVVDGRPQMNYFNERLRAYEFALLNIKQLGYEFGRQIGIGNLHREVKHPPDKVLKSSLCTQADVESDWFAFWCSEIKSAPIYHRKLWELCYISHAVWKHGKLVPGARGLGFGCGEEPLPSLFAKYGVHVLATDLDLSRPEAKGWRETGQHSDSAESLRNRDICPDEQLLANIVFRSADMNDIPADLDGQFDFCWSACALEHVGSIEKGLKFIENSLRTLKPGGVAVHTTEFNLEDGETIDNWGTVLFQKKHIVDFAAHLESRGFHLAPLDFNSGDKILDGFVDIPPWGHDALRLLETPVHLKLSVDGKLCTSIGLIVQSP